MLDLIPASAPKRGHKFIHKLILRPLRQHDANKLELCRMILLPGIVSKSAIASETNIIFFAREFIKAAIIQPR